MKYLLSLFVIIATVSCSDKQEFDKATIEKEVKEMLLAFDDSVRKQGINGEFFFLDKSDAFYWVPPGYKYALHYDSIAKILREYAPRFQFVDNSWETLEILALSEKYASFKGVLNSTMITIENDTTSGVFFERGLVIKRGEHWKLLSGQTSAINNDQ